MSKITTIYKMDALKELISSTVRCDLKGAWEIESTPADFEGGWSTTAPSLSVLLEGEIETVIEGDENKTLTWRRGDVFLLQPHMRRRHRIVSRGSVRSVRYLSVLMSCEVGNGLDLFSFFDMPLLYYGKDAEILADILQRVRVCKEEVENFRGSLLITTLCYELAHWLVKNATLKAGASSRIMGVTRLSEALAYMSLHFREPLDLATLAQLSNVSQSRFHGIFKEVMGCAPLEYMKQLRLSEASTLLLTTTDSVAEIGMRLGWPDPFHFSRTFKKCFGESPRGYRNRFAPSQHQP